MSERTDLEIKRDAYRDYIELKKNLDRELKNNINMDAWKDYVYNLSSASIINIFDEVFDFDYNDMCLTIQQDEITSEITLEDFIDIYDEDGNIIWCGNLKELEKEVRK